MSLSPVSLSSKKSVVSLEQCREILLGFTENLKVMTAVYSTLHVDLYDGDFFLQRVDNEPLTHASLYCCSDKNHDVGIRDVVLNRFSTVVVLVVGLVKVHDMGLHWSSALFAHRNLAEILLKALYIGKLFHWCRIVSCIQVL